MVKDYSFSDDEAEILTEDVVKANAIKSVIFSGKTSYRITKTDHVSDATVLFLDTQEETPEDVTTEDTIILDETEQGIKIYHNKLSQLITTTRDTATNNISNDQEVDDASALIVRKFNDLSDKVEKGLHDIEDQITGI